MLENSCTSATSIVSASSDFGVSGTVAIDAPDTDVTAGVSGLPVAFFDPSVLLGDRCAARVAGKSSSFVATGRGGVPPGPASLLGASYFEAGLDGGAEEIKQGASDPSPPEIITSASERVAATANAALVLLPDFVCAK